MGSGFILLEQIITTRKIVIIKECKWLAMCVYAMVLEIFNTTHHYTTSLYNTLLMCFIHSLMWSLRGMISIVSLKELETWLVWLDNTTPVISGPIRRISSSVTDAMVSIMVTLLVNNYKISMEYNLLYTALIDDGIVIWYNIPLEQLLFLS